MRVHVPQLRPALRALVKRGQEIEAFALASSRKPDRGNPGANSEELQLEQNEDLKSDCERRGHGQEREDDRGSEKAEKSACQYFIFSPNYDLSVG